MSFTLQAGRKAATAMSDAERRMRVDLAACYRLVALHGWDDMIYTHISARVPDAPDSLRISSRTPEGFERAFELTVGAGRATIPPLA